MLKTRIITALIGLPCVLYIFIACPQWVVALFLLCVTGVSIFECASMILPACDRLVGEDVEDIGVEEQAFDITIMIGFCFVIACLTFIAAVNWSKDAMNGMMIFGLLTTICVGIFSSSKVDQAVSRTMGMLVSLAYSVFPWVVIWEIVITGKGSRYFFLLIAIVWSGDTAAYFAGKYFGRHKLSARSPNKTLEGSVAGLIASTLAAVGMNLLYDSTLAGWFVIVAIGLFGGLLGQIGDLVESTLKRFAKVKDSGVLFPGHGGLLDRVDGLVFSAPFVWLILYANT